MTLNIEAKYQLIILTTEQKVCLSVVLANHTWDF